MRNRNVPETSQQDTGTVDTDTDRYPSVKELLHRVIDQVEFPDQPVDYFEVNLFASGEATYRMRRARAEDTDGGYLPPPDSG